MFKFWRIWLVLCPWTPIWKVYWDSEVSLIQDSYLLCISDMMWRMGQDIPLSKCIDKKFTVSPASSDLVDLFPNIRCNNCFIFRSLLLWFWLFLHLNQIYIFLSVLRVVMSPRSVHYHLKKSCKTLYEKVRHVPNLLM